MLKIDNSLLEEIGLGGLPDVEKNSFLKHVYETLEMRVGIRLADQMTNEQLDEFEQYFEAKDDAGAFKWLETNFPNYKDIVQEEFDKLKAEVAQSAPQILAASQAAQTQAGAAAVPIDPGQLPQQNQPAPAQPPAPGAPAAPTAPQPPTAAPYLQPAPQQPQQPSAPAAPQPSPSTVPQPAYDPSQPPPQPQYFTPPQPPAPQAPPPQPPFPPQQPPPGSPQ